MFAPLYHCEIHGDIWEVEHVEYIDTDNDEVYRSVLCKKCNHEVTPVLHDGKQVFHALSHEEVFWETYLDSDEDYL